MRKLFTLLVISVSIFACDGNQDGNVIIPHNVNMVVNSYTRECTGEGTFQCLQVQEGDLIGTNEWHNFYDGIDGFQYEPGYVYYLIVTKRTVPNPPADGSSISYQLKEVVSKKKV